MKKITTMKSSIILFCCVGLLIVDADAPFAACRQNDPKQARPSPKIESPNASTEIKFDLILVGNGLTSDGIPTDFKKFRSSNGNDLFQTWINFGTVARAAQEMRTLFKSSVKTVQKSSELDEHGQQVGEKILVLRPEGKSGGIEAVLGWTRGAMYQQIRSSSLRDLTAFEEQLHSSTKVN